MLHEDVRRSHDDDVMCFAQKYNGLTGLRNKEKRQQRSKPAQQQQGQHQTLGGVRQTLKEGPRGRLERNISDCAMGREDSCRPDGRGNKSTMPSQPDFFCPQFFFPRKAYVASA